MKFFKKKESKEILSCRWYLAPDKDSANFDFAIKAFKEFDLEIISVEYRRNIEFKNNKNYVRIDFDVSGTISNLDAFDKKYLLSEDFGKVLY